MSPLSISVQMSFLAAVKIRNITEYSVDILLNLSFAYQHFELRKTVSKKKIQKNIRHKKDKNKIGHASRK